MAELRVVAAIDQGVLESDYKTQLCSMHATGEECPNGQSTHSQGSLCIVSSYNRQI